MKKCGVKPLSARNFGTSYAFDAFGEVMARSGAGLVVSSRTGYMPHALTAEDEYALAMIPTANKAHIAEDHEVFDFKLSDEEMRQMTALDKNERFADY